MSFCDQNPEIWSNSCPCPKYVVRRHFSRQTITGHSCMLLLELKLRLQTRRRVRINSFSHLIHPVAFIAVCESASHPLDNGTCDRQVPLGHFVSSDFRLVIHLKLHYPLCYHLQAKCVHLSHFSRRNIILVKNQPHC